MKEKIKKLSAKVATVATVLGTGGVAFASEPTGNAAAVATALTSTASEITGTVTAVAPVALGIFGTFMVWKYGKKFFKSLLG